MELANLSVAHDQSAQHTDNFLGEVVNRSKGPSIQPKMPKSKYCCRCSFICNRFNDAELKKPSNETLLCVAFVSFTGFASVQTVVALIAKSEAMVGDSAAMFVDALTYGFNLYAERQKNEDDDENTTAPGGPEGEEQSEIELTTASLGDGADISPRDAARMKLERHLQKRRRHLHLELVPPIMSVSILIVVVSLVLRNSINTLILDAHRSEKEQTIPNLVLMMTFSVLNLLLDVVNVLCFARAKHLMGYKTSNEGEDEGQAYDAIGASGSSEDEAHGTMPIENAESQNGTAADETNDNVPGNKENDEGNRVNLNMCSAYTHVFADTLRSIAVILASIIAISTDSVTPEVADATAAVIVSAIIFISLIPLFHGILDTWCELRSITREENELYNDDDSVALLDDDPDVEGELS